MVRPTSCKYAKKQNNKHQSNNHPIPGKLSTSVSDTTANPFVFRITYSNFFLFLFLISTIHYNISYFYDSFVTKSTTLPCYIVPVRSRLKATICGEICVRAQIPPPTLHLISIKILFNYKK